MHPYTIESYGNDKLERLHQEARTHRLAAILRRTPAGAGNRSGASAE